MSNSSNQPTRRDFLKHASVAAGCIAAPTFWSASAAGQVPAKGVWIVVDPEDPVASPKAVQFALNDLSNALDRRGVRSQICRAISQAPTDAICIVAGGARSSASREMFESVLPEALGIVPTKLDDHNALLVIGADTNGLVYALTDLAQAVASNQEPLSALAPTKPVAEAPANKVRSVMRLFTSDIEDKPWFNSQSFWKDYLSMLVAQRFNRFNLAMGIGYDFARELRDTYFYFAYPFLLKVPGYDVRATNLRDQERDSNLQMLRWISDEVVARGLQFQLGLWTHAYQWTNSPNVNHNIEGLPQDKHAEYCRESLRLLLRECPNISGITFRIHGESGVAEGSYDFWKTIFDGVANVGREIRIDMHAKGIDQKMIDVGLATGMPVTVTPKFWAEHMGLPYHQAAIRPTEVPTGRRATGLMALSTGSRSFTRYGYADLLREDRKYEIVHRVWPGTQRVLLWGDPTFASAYSRAMSFCGSAGCEFMEPLSFKGRKGSGLPIGRTAYADESLKTSVNDFEKYLITYRLWGRMLYNPAYELPANLSNPALAAASRILPLITTAHLPSAANNNFWPEMYVNMSIVEEMRPNPYGDTPSPKRFNFVSPLDPQLFSRIDDYAGELLSGKVSGKYSPVEVATWLEELAHEAMHQQVHAEANGAKLDDLNVRRAAIDVAIQAGLGRFFGQKLRAGVLYAIYEHTGEAEALKQAVATYQSARDAWARVVDEAKGVYANDVTFGPEWFQRGNWADRLAAIEKDIATMSQATTAANSKSTTKAVDVAQIIKDVLGKASRVSIAAEHTPPKTFDRGQPIQLEVKTGGAASVLYYRHVSQAEPWRSASMEQADGACRATIAGEYTNSPFPLQYYFELRDASGRAALYPGLGESLTNQPYFVVSSRTGA